MEVQQVNMIVQTHHIINIIPSVIAHTTSSFLLAHLS